jgi:DNA primase
MQGRSRYDECKKCGMYHNLDIPCPEKGHPDFTKWKNSPDFNCSEVLYNLWSARQNIMDTNTIVLVEGAGDVWRLEERGIKNSLGMFGLDLTEQQMSILESSWCMNIVLATDNDKAGKKAVKNLEKKLSRMYNIYIPEYFSEENSSITDVGGMTSEEVDRYIGSILEKIK